MEIVCAIVVFVIAMSFSRVSIVPFLIMLAAYVWWEPLMIAVGVY